MRQIFASIRLETVEGVARLLNEHGVQTRITGGRSYHGNRRRVFSYRHADREPQAVVWVLRAEDLPKARALMRQAGLMGSTRVDSPVPDDYQLPARSGRPMQAANRIRLALLVAVAAGAVLVAMRACGIGVGP
ncbi:MAG TPA: pathogenicity-like protein [Xanthomonadaceae bacterium]|nr:pathogenicity-like protein [Xanthomonadaceae bacterium]